MDGRSYLRWLEAIDLLSMGQRAEIGVILLGRPAESEVGATLEQGSWPTGCVTVDTGRDWCAEAGPMACGGFGAPGATGRTMP